MMNRSGTLASLVCVICAVPMPAPGATIHVAPTGNDAGSGATWQEAKLTIAAGLAAAAAGDQVWVATGVYVERITLKAGVALYGGFDQTEATPADRAPFPRQVADTSASVLDGSRGTVVTSPQGATSTTRIDGFTIRNGGYGIYCVSSSPTIVNNTVTGTSGISCSSSSSVISNNLITSNSSRGIYCYSSPVTISHNLISDNDGEGISTSSSAAIISDNRIVRNRRGYAGISCSAPTSGTVVITNNLIAGNSGGWAGGVDCTASSGSVVIAGNRIVGNSCEGSSGKGGGIHCSSTTTSIVNNTIVGNDAGFNGQGGGIYLSSGSTVIANNIIAHNASGIYNSLGTVTLRKNCVYNPEGPNYASQQGTLAPDVGDIGVDPQLVSVAYGEVHLKADSPCIDAGGNADVQPGWVDMDGEPRIQGASADIGADEFNGAAPDFTPRTVYVSKDGQDANDGANWASAKQTIQAGMEAAGVTGGDVWVAGGVYAEQVNLRFQTFLFGGFSGTETAREQRDPATHVTTVDGGGNKPPVTAWVVQGASSVAGLQMCGIDGFTIRNGTRAGVEVRYASPVISNNVITGNAAPGIVCAYTPSPLISENRITGNANGTLSASGLSFTYSGGSVLRNIITHHTATSGGGISCVAESSPLIAGNLIAGNGASNGAGIYCVSASPRILNNTIVGNLATSQGGAIYIGGSAAPTVANNILALNSSGLAGQGATPSLANNCLYNPDGDDYSGVTPGAGDVIADPQFVSAKFGRFQLKAGSPCIDAGTDSAGMPLSLDLDGQPRVHGAQIDIGADEFDGATPSYAQRIVRVSPSGNDANDGSTWGLARRSIQGAIDAAAITGGEVWVAAGTYSELLVLKGWTYLYGGFAGSEEQRDPRSRGSGGSIVDAGNLGSVVTARALGNRTAGMDGFTLTNGKGGIDCRYASMAFSNLTVSGNAGTGISCSTSPKVSILNSVVQSNSGSGITFGSSSPSPVLVNNTVVRNSGTGISLSTFPAVLANSIVAFNSLGISGSGNSVLQRNCVYNPDGINYSGLSPGATDLQVDPLLVAERYGRVHLRSDSPCINAGDDASADAAWADMDGEARVQGGRVDIGADEFNGTAPSYTPAIVRVSPDGSDANDGSTWALAKQTVQAAVDVAAVAGGDVWVAAGVYNQRITLPAWVYAYGGFAGTEESRNERDWRAHASVLDGGSAGTVVRAVARGFRTTTIDGFTIRNGSDSGIYCDYSCPVIAHNAITGNSGANGGGIYCTVTGPVIVGNIITGNSATGPATQSGLGGGVYCGSAQLYGNLIAGNTAASIGGGVYSPLGTVSIANNTVVGNTAADKGGAIGWGANVTGSVANNVLAFNSSGVYGPATATPPALSHNCLYHPDGESYSGVSAGTGDVALDPLFVNMQAGDYRLASDSPCIDAGNNTLAPAWLTSDLGLQARFIDDAESEDCRHAPGTCGSAPIIDMGAYEYNPATTADLDHDGHIDAADFEIFLAAFGRSRGHALYNAYADHDADGIVSLADYQHWLQQYRVAVGDPLAAAPLEVLGDFDRNGRVDAADFQHLVNCASGAGVPQVGEGCRDADLDRDSDVDQDDFGFFQRCYSGERQVSLSCRQ